MRKPLCHAPELGSSKMVALKSHQNCPGARAGLLRSRFSIFYSDEGDLQSDHGAELGRLHASCDCCYLD